MKQGFEIRYIVLHGEGLFPVDALRKFKAHPFRSEDSIAILSPGKRTVILCSYVAEFAEHPEWGDSDWELVDTTNNWSDAITLLEKLE